MVTHAVIVIKDGAPRSGGGDTEVMKIGGEGIGSNECCSDE